MRLAIYLLLIAVNASYAQQLLVDEHHSSIIFQVQNFGVDVRGTLAGAKGTIVLDTADITLSSFRLSADATTIDSGISLRDQHLRKHEYLDAKTYGIIEFVSTSVAKTKLRDEIMVKGRLKIKNTSNEIVVPVRIARSNKGVDFAGSFTINRLDYMVGTHSITLADQVKIEFLISTNKLPGRQSN